MIGFYVVTDRLPNDLHGLSRRRFHKALPSALIELGFAFKQHIVEPEFAMPRYASNEVSTPYGKQ